MNYGIFIKGIREDLGKIEYRVIDLDNDRECIRDGDQADITITGTTTFAAMVQACKDDATARGYGYVFA